ncbi:MAG TPA: hypothetical protein VJS39_04155 [Gemmatimonadaceae bacterium]|nr:hypothetical protein [Gemmatimonadaceae bacterium]
MAINRELREAFDEALAVTRREKAAGMSAIDGSPAAGYLDQLERELLAEQERALDRGAVDKDWFQKTVRWLVEWVPETDLALIAALGQIARAKPSKPV